jgi:hypothetical protein
MSDIKNLRTNYILIDFENVQPSSLDLPESVPIKIIVFVGANQKKIPIELATSMQNLGNNAEYVLINSIGKNALDFHITFYLGKLYEKDHKGFFHIISKDTGFDILINYLKEKKISINRYNAIEEIPILKKSSWALISMDEKIKLSVEHLIKRGNSKPRKVETLFNSLNSLSGNTLNKSQLKTLINTLAKRKIIIIEETKVTYKLKDNKYNRL